MKLKIIAIIATGAILAISLSACSDADNDRSGGAGKSADKYDDTTSVVVYRNADHIPNVAYFCAGEYGWASTLSGGDSGSAKQPSLVRLPEYDKNCSSAQR